MKYFKVKFDFFLLILLQGGMLQAIERYMKQAIVDKNSSVSSAALVSSLVSILINRILNFAVFSLDHSIQNYQTMYKFVTCC